MSIDIYNLIQMLIVNINVRSLTPIQCNISDSLETWTILEKWKVMETRDEYIIKKQWEQGILCTSP